MAVTSKTISPASWTPSRRALLVGGLAASVAPAWARTATEPAFVVDASHAPEIADYLETARRDAIAWYPMIVTAIGTTGYRPPSLVVIQGVSSLGFASGVTSGARIRIAASYVFQHKSDRGLVGHELTHVVQEFPPRSPLWLTEGIADWVRYYVIETCTPRARFDPTKSRYTQGYQPAAALLQWVELHRRRGAVQVLTTALRAGAYSDDVFRSVAGDTPDACWDAMIKGA